MKPKRARPKKKITAHFSYSLLGDRYTLSGQAHIVAAAEKAYKRVYGDL